MSSKVKLHTDESLFPYMDGRRSVNTYTVETSRKARLNVNVKKQCGIILRYIVDRGDLGACDFEGIRDLVGPIPTANNSYRPRRGKLFEAGLIEVASFTRNSPSGCECEVWVATAQGRLDAARECKIHDDVSSGVVNGSPDRG